MASAELSAVSAAAAAAEGAALHGAAAAAPAAAAAAPAAAPATPAAAGAVIEWDDIRSGALLTPNTPKCLHNAALKFFRWRGESQPGLPVTETVIDLTQPAVEIRRPHRAARGPDFWFDDDCVTEMWPWRVMLARITQKHAEGEFFESGLASMRCTWTPGSVDHSLYSQFKKRYPNTCRRFGNSGAPWATAGSGT